MIMGKSQKSKRVFWASDVNLCQVRLFSSEESPSQVGTGTQDHLHAVKLGVNGSDDNLPPGFEAMQPANMPRANLPKISSINWKSPPRFKVNIEWRVVAGEESEEVETQNEREMRLLEAIYPRQSDIPLNPSLAGVEDSITNDQNIPLVPVTPIEDDDDAADAPSANNNPTIDPNLLMKILSDPKMIEQLVTSQNIPSSNMTIMPSSIPSASSPYMPHWRSPPNGPFYPPPRPNNPESPSHGANMAKDINYYKSLIQQHGEERQRDVIPQFGHHQSIQPMGTSQDPLKRESKPKMNKPCIYFNSSRGCRKGANCTFQHEISAQQSIGGIMEAQSAKRVKVDRGITGT